jgi:hypothetical protein
VYITKEIVSESPTLLILKDTPKTTATVLKLSESLLGKDHKLWHDNCYNYPDSAKLLKSCNNECVWTMKMNRKNVSKIEVKKLQEVKVIVQHNGPVYTFK